MSADNKRTTLIDRETLYSGRELRTYPMGTHVGVRLGVPDELRHLNGHWLEIVGQSQLRVWGVDETTKVRSLVDGKRYELSNRTIAVDIRNAVDDGHIKARVSGDGRRADEQMRPWTVTHVVLLEQQIAAVLSHIEIYDNLEAHGRSRALDEENTNARDFYQRLRQALINMRRPVDD